MKFLDLITGKIDKRPRPVNTPEWPDLAGKCFVRWLSPVERIAFYDLAEKEKADRGAAFHALMTAYCACNEQGERGFADGDWKALLEEHPGSVLERISGEADALNAISFGVREELKKTSAPPQASGSIPASPEKTESA